MFRLIAGGTIGFVAFIFVLTVVFGSWYTIDAGERGVILRNGAVIGVADPGLHFKLPLVDDVEKISQRTFSRYYEHVVTYSRDQQPADLRVSVNYRLGNDVVGLYLGFGSGINVVERVLDRRIEQAVKTAFGQFNAVTAIQERSRLNAEVLAAVKRAIDNPALLVETVQIENIDYSDEYERSIEQRMQAEVEVLKLRQNAEREKVQAEITVINANAKAAAVKAEAEAQATAIKLRGEAEALAIKARGEALMLNPNLPVLTAAERWNGYLPTTMVPGSALPFINMPGIAGK